MLRAEQKTFCTSNIINRCVRYTTIHDGAIKVTKSPFYSNCITAKRPIWPLSFGNPPQQRVEKFKLPIHDLRGAFECHTYYKSAVGSLLTGWGCIMASPALRMRVTSPDIQP